jgi:hypothetical protein
MIRHRRWFPAEFHDGVKAGGPFKAVRPGLFPIHSGKQVAREERLLTSRAATRHRDKRQEHLDALQLQLAGDLPLFMRLGM